VKLLEWLKLLYVQVLVALALGVLVGYLYPAFGSDLKVLGDIFIKFVRMLIAPIVFVTIVLGLARIGDIKSVGRIGLIAIVYFEVITTIALLIGLAIGNLAGPGRGMNVDPATLDAAATQSFVKSAQGLTFSEQLLGVVPNSWVGAFVQGEGIQVLLVALLFGFAVMASKGATEATVRFLDELSRILFRIVGFVMRLAPIGAFGAMAFTVGRYGLTSLLPLVKMIATVYLTSFLFIALVLGAVARLAGFSLWKLLVYTKEEILITLGTCSSEAVMPQIMTKLEWLGCPKPVVGLVLPAGYAFNLDGTCLYLTMAVVFLSQALNIPLSIGDQIEILLVLMLMSKGVAGVVGIGFVTLAAALAVHGGKIPVAALALLIGIDRFMSEARAVTSLIGNIVGTVAVARWVGGVDMAVLRERLADPTAGVLPHTSDPEAELGQLSPRPS
jgi:aerobic C4-dicarboxylate transport protein